MKINQLWQKHAIDLTQTRCIMVSGQTGRHVQKGLLLSRVSHPNPIYDLGCSLKWNKQSWFEQNQIQTDDNSCGEEI